MLLKFSYLYYCIDISDLKLDNASKNLYCIQLINDLEFNIDMRFKVLFPISCSTKVQYFCLVK